MIGLAIYKGEQVQVLDYIISRAGLILLINYGGPVWVFESELTNMQLLNDKGA